MPVSVKQVISAGEEPLHPPLERNVLALIDTGASNCCVDESLAAELGLSIIDRQVIGGVAGQQEHNIYLAELVIPNLQLSMKGRLVGVNIEMLKNVALEGPSQVILGRDVMSLMVVVYDGVNGTVTLCR
jgi:hypothetical protein